MSRRLHVLVAVLLLLLPSGTQAWTAASPCDPSACCCEVPEPSPGPAVTRGCCCEAQPAPELPFESPAPERAPSAGPELPEFEACPAEALPPAAPVRPVVRVLRSPAPRPPPRPLFLLHAAFLC